MDTTKKNNIRKTMFAITAIVSISLIGLTGCNKAENDGVRDEINSGVVNNDDTNDKGKPDEGTPGPEQGTSEPGAGTSDPVEQNQATYYGEWIINQVQAAGVGTYSNEDIEGLIGKHIKFTADEANYFGDNAADIDQVATSPIYTESVISDSDFVADYRIPLSNLGIDSTTVTAVNVSNPKGNVANFFIKDDNTLILLGGGTYFELIRENSQMKQMGYIKEMNTERKTITFNQVELLFSTDEERLAELGMNSDDLVTGYSIYDEEVMDEQLTYGDDLTIELLDETTTLVKSIEDLDKLVEKREVLCKVTLKDNVVIKIQEQYLP